MKQLFADQLGRFCAQQPKLQVALVECNPEALAQLKEQLRHMDGIELHTLLLEQVQQHLGRLVQQMDVTITTDRTCKTACRDDRAGGKSCIVSRPQSPALQHRKASARAARRIARRSGLARAKLRKAWHEYTQGLQIAGPALFDPPESLSAYLSGKDAVLVPEGYEKLCTQKALGLLTQFAAHARLISCSYQIDEGSAIYLTERLERLLANRSPK